MAKLERLIAKLCPDGVEIAILENLAEIGTGSNNTVDGLEEGLFPFFVRSQKVRYMPPRPALRRFDFKVV